MQNILYVNTLSAGGGAAAVMQQLRRLMARRGLHTPLLTGRPAPGEDRALRRQEYGGLFSWCRWRGLLDYHVRKSHALVEHPFFQTVQKALNASNVENGQMAQHLPPHQWDTAPHHRALGRQSFQRIAATRSPKQASPPSQSPQTPGTSTTTIPPSREVVA